MELKDTLYVNFFAGPGVGKSTMMAHCFAELKWLEYDCEMVTEYAKDKVWEGSTKILENQLYITANQFHRLKRLNGKVDIVLTDSPLLLGLFYGKSEPKGFKELILKYFNSLNNLNFFLERYKKFNPNGRLQNEEESKKIDIKILKLIQENKIEGTFVKSKKENVLWIVEKIQSAKLLNTNS